MREDTDTAREEAAEGKRGGGVAVSNDVVGVGRVFEKAGRGRTRGSSSCRKRNVLTARTLLVRVVDVFVSLSLSLLLLLLFLLFRSLWWYVVDAVFGSEPPSSSTGDARFGGGRREPKIDQTAVVIVVVLSTGAGGISAGQDD